MVAYESGIRNFWEERFRFSAHFLTMGAKMITMGVLFRNADINEIGNITRRNNDLIFPLRRGKKKVASLVSAPDCVIPSLTTNSIATVTIPLFEKPASTSLALMVPNIIRNISAENRISPGRITSLAKAAIMMITIANTINPCAVIVL
jgi:hypothetical protein